MKQFDAIVVGAGNSGLIAALRLTKYGYKTLIIEKHNLPGGCATSFVRGRFEIEPSLHELCDVGEENNPGKVLELLNELGVHCQWITVKDCFRAIGTFSDNSPMDVTMPNGQDAFIAKMEDYVPGSCAKMNVLFSIFKEIASGLEYISKYGSGNVSYLVKTFPNMLTLGSYSVKKVFDALSIPSKCQDILGIYWSYLGVDLEHLNFIHYASMVNSYVTKTIRIPKNTSHSLSSHILKTYQDLGGEIWYGVNAESFIFKDKKCVGVKTNIGEIYAPLLFPDINQDIVYKKMVPSNITPIRQTKLYNARKDCYGGIFCTGYFCLDKSPEELGIKDYSIFLLGNVDSKAEYDSIKNGMNYSDYCVFLCYNIADPSFSPEGTCVCSFTTLVNPKEFESIEEKDYKDIKTKIGRKMISVLKNKTGIDISNHVEEVEIATPWTFSRYLNTPKGSVYGHETRDWDNVIARTLNIDKDYIIPGLYPIGADSIKGDGYSSAFIVGRDIVDYAIKKEGNNVK